MRGWGIAVAAITAGTACAGAQTYPDRPVEITVPFSAGAVTDVLGRALADGMSGELGQRVLVVNKAGATGAIGSAAVARAAPDGYSLLFTAAVSMTVVPLQNKQIGYDLKSFEPICQTFKNDQVIVARPNTYQTVADLIAAAKAKTGGLNFGSPGIGTIPHLSMAELSQISKTEFNHVPFRGPAEAIQMAHAGQIDFSVAPLTAAANSGLVMPGLFAEKRNSSIPDVPTVPVPTAKHRGRDWSGPV